MRSSFDNFIFYLNLSVAKPINAKIIAKELLKALGNTQIYLGGLGTQGVVKGELQDGIILADKDTLETLNKV